MDKSGAWRKTEAGDGVLGLIIPELVFVDSGGEATCQGVAGEGNRAQCREEGRKRKATERQREKPMKEADEGQWEPTSGRRKRLRREGAAHLCYNAGPDT